MHKPENSLVSAQSQHTLGLSGLPPHPEAPEQLPLWLLLELTTELATATTLEELQNLLARRLRWLLDFDGATLAVRLTSASPAFSLFEIAPTPTRQDNLVVNTESWPGRVLCEGKPYFLPDLATLPPGLTIPKDPTLGVCEAPQALMLLPLRAGGAVVGALLFSTHKLFSYSPELRQRATILAMQLGGQLGTILAHLQTRTALAALEKAETLNLFLAEQRLSSEIALALSHRLNNLLATAVASVELAELAIPELVDFVGNNAEGSGILGTIRQLEEDLTQIGQACHGATEVLRRAGQFGRISSQSTSGRYSVVELVDEALELVAVLYRGENMPQIRLENYLSAAEIVVVKGDRARAVRAVVALLKNAVEACPKTDGKVVIELARGSRADGKVYCLVRVSDNGPGLSAELARQLYEPFTTTKPIVAGQGLGHLGLDLALTHAFAGSADGWLEYRRSDTGGACFSLALPAA